MNHGLVDRLRGIDPIADLFFKRRTVFSIDRDEYKTRGTTHESYDLVAYCGRTDPSELRAESHQFLSERIGEATLKRRQKRGDCSLFIAVERSSDEPAGFYWAVRAASTPVWHDSFRVPPGSGLVFNAYVAQPHRRQGVYRLLQSATHNYLFDSGACERVFTIVEDRNAASMRANEEFGLQKDGKNYLVKLLSINVFSIIDGSAGSKTHFVLPRGGL